MKKQTTLAARVWATLKDINVNEHTEKKNGLTYLSWAWAWGTLMEHYPDSYYAFNESQKENGTVMVECTLSIHEGEECVTRSMWLSVMNYNNKAILNPSTSDISNTRMRCLVKVMAMFGLGHYIYAGEDVPQAEKPDEDAVISEEQAKTLKDLFDTTGADWLSWANHYKVKDMSELPADKYEQVYSALRGDMETAERSAAQSEAVDEYEI